MKYLFLFSMTMFIGCSSMKIPDDYAKQWCECVENAKNDHEKIVMCDSVLSNSFRLAMIDVREEIVKNKQPMETFALHLNDHTRELYRLKNACKDSMIKAGLVDSTHFEASGASQQMPMMEMKKNK
jgi:hypothetical protein